MLKIGLFDNLFAHTTFQNGYDSCCMLPTQSFSWERNIEIINSNLIDTIVFTDESLYIAQYYKNSNKKKIAWLLEPKVISFQTYEYVKNNESNFDFIVSHDLEFINSLKNGKYAPFGGAWIKKNDWNINLNKRKNISIIASDKKITEGHKLRHLSANLLLKEDRYGKGYLQIEDKITALKDYKFSIVIENGRIEGYFSEKLIDSLITCTIPLYWGDPNINNFFDMNGIIEFNDIEELKNIINNLNFEEYYEKSKEAIIFNAKKAKMFVSTDENFYSSIIK